MNIYIKDMFLNIIILSTINSFIVFGVTTTIKRIANREELNRFVGLSITYISGVVQGFLIEQPITLWERLLLGFFIGSISVGIYKAAVQSLLGFIPAILGKLLGVENRVGARIGTDFEVEKKESPGGYKDAALPDKTLPRGNGEASEGIKQDTRVIGQKYIEGFKEQNNEFRKD